MRPIYPHSARRQSLILLLMISLCGCASAYQEPDSRTFGEFTDDVALLSKVKAGLIGDKTVSGLRINVDVYRRRVTLSGKVKTAAQRQQAVDIARSVKGVAAVENRLILPPAE